MFWEILAAPFGEDYQTLGMSEKDYFSFHLRAEVHLSSLPFWIIHKIAFELFSIMYLILYTIEGILMAHLTLGNNISISNG